MRRVSGAFWGAYQWKCGMLYKFFTPERRWILCFHCVGLIALLWGRPSLGFHAEYSYLQRHHDNMVQSTTAENNLFPPDRAEACACAVVTAADKSSYNIYVHGGFSNGTIDDGLWILTLPSFHWIRSDIGMGNTRAGHTCTKVRETFMAVYRWYRNWEM